MEHLKEEYRYAKLMVVYDGKKHRNFLSYPKTREGTGWTDHYLNRDLIRNETVML